MTAQEAYDILYDNILFDLYHEDYKRVCDLADNYFTFNTGKGIEKKLFRFSPREEEEMMEQRIRLTIAITPASVSSLKKPYNKVPRTQPVTRKITAITDADKEAVGEIEDRISKFDGNDNMDYWFQNRFTNMSFDDPNKWIVIEFPVFDPIKEKARPHPFEVPAKQAINFSVTNNITDWLITAFDITFKEISGNKIEIRQGKKYTIYADNDAWTFEQTSERDADRILEVPGSRLVEIDRRGTYIVNHYPTNTQGVPAERVGYIRDIETNGRTFVNPYHDATCYMEQSIQDCSEFAISKRCHVFPQKVIRTEFDCPGFEFNGVKQNCDHGKLTDGTTCPRCNGNGKLIHTSGQDVIEAKMPETKEELIPLSEYIAYVQGIPIDILRLQKELVDELTLKLHQTVFNSTALIRTSATGSTGVSDQPINKTATEQNDNMESVYDALTPFSEKISSLRVWFIKLIAILTDNIEKVIIVDRPASKFKLKTRQDLYNERATVKTSGAPAFVIDSIDDELAQDVYADDAEGLLRYMIKKDHYPFIGKSTEEIQQLLNSSTVLKRTKVLYNYFDEIFTELEREWKTKPAPNNNFYLEKADVRIAAIDEKVNNILQQLNDENATAVQFSIAAFNQKNNPIADTNLQTEQQQSAA